MVDVVLVEHLEALQATDDDEVVYVPEVVLDEVVVLDELEVKHIQTQFETPFIDELDELE